MVKWIYEYLRADGEEIDMGPFETQEECEKAKKEHESFGALCKDPECVADDYKLYKG